MSLIPDKKPGRTHLEVLNILGGNGISQPLAVLGVRGEMSTGNHREVYDDAIYLCAPGGVFLALNGNVDPNGFRKGHGTSESAKGMASLKPSPRGGWLYELGMHKGEYLALVQAAAVTVFRDADSSVPASKVFQLDGLPVYEDTGDFGIHIHHGSVNGTSSLGCQTIPPGAQWDSFIAAVQAGVKASGQKIIPYCLINS